MPTRRAVDVLPVEARVGHRLAGAVDADAAGAGAAADLLALLVAELVEVADPRQGGAKVADFVGRHAAAARQQGLAELGQGIPVRRGKSHAGNHNPLLVRPFHAMFLPPRCQSHKATRFGGRWQAASEADNGLLMGGTATYLSLHRCLNGLGDTARLTRPSRGPVVAPCSDCEYHAAVPTGQSVGPSVMPAGEQ